MEGWTGFRARIIAAQWPLNQRFRDRFRLSCTAPTGPQIPMTRSKLFQFRFAATAGVLLLVFGIVRILWFPGDYFAISGITKLLLVLVAVNIVIGPGLSTLLYKRGKWGLKFDLVLIACIEIAVLCWALYEIHDRRPAFAVFVVDRFEAVTRSEVDLTALTGRGLGIRPSLRPQLVYAALPTDPDIMSQLIDDTLFLGKKDIDRRPEFWEPYSNGIAEVKAVARPLSRFVTPQDARAVPIQNWLQKQNGQLEDFVYLPMQARAGDAIVVIDVDSGYPVEVLAIDPWSSFPAESGESSP